MDQPNPASLIIPLALVTAAIPILSSTLAYRKGFAWFLWLFSGGLLGLVVLAFLQSGNEQQQEAELNHSRRRTGNVVGALLSLMTLSMAAFGVLQGIAAPCTTHVTRPTKRYP